MPLTPGDKLGPYEILGPLGAGGMGEVYKARDAHLNREVAIKTLPPSLANDADYLARFQREAQTLATLHHPNIASIYGLEQNAIVMELAAGQTLRGPLPLTDALPIARQIAEALEAAHEKGIIHRDLKPGNIMVAPDGTIKVLDFGLAKSIERPNENSSNSPTLTLRSTEAGLILGTAGYMSPEQAAGKPVDRRADIWAFGVVFYELLTGQRLFDGETVSHTLADVLKGDIDFTPIPEGPIRDLIQRCLDRNLKTRLSHIAEARIAIDNYVANPTTPTKPVQAPSHRPWAAVAALSFIAALAAWSPWLRKPAASAERLTFELNPPAGSHWTSIFAFGGSAISPDGRTLAFVAINDKGQNLLHIRQLDSLDARPLPGTDNAARPFWSPDGKSIAFGAGGKLKRIDLAGGSPIALCDLRVGRGGTWNEEGVILFADQLASLQRISASGGTPAPVTQLDKKSAESAHYYPQFLPGGKKFLYHVRSRERENTGIYLGSLDGAPSVRILQTEFKALYDPASRRLLYIQGNSALMAQTLELDPPRLTGDPVTLAEDVGKGQGNSYADFSISNNGTLLYGRAGASRKSRFIWRDRAGKSLGAVGQPVDSVVDFALSPDDSRVAYVSLGDNQDDAWVLELARGVTRRVTFNGATHVRWSPGSDFLYYTNPKGILRKPSDGSGEEHLVLKGSLSDSVHAIAPNGKALLYGTRDILIHSLGEDKPPMPYFEAKNALGGRAVFSPDGRWVAYASTESGRAEVYIQGYPERRGKWLVSSSGGTAPRWRADGKEIFWRRPSDGMILAASVELQPSGIRLGPSEALFPVFASLEGSPLAVARNGRFLIPELETAQQDRPMVVIQNWAARIPQ